MNSAYQTLKVFSASELHQATGGFHKICLIGEGGFGKVYHAMINLTPVAIKVLDHEGLQGMREFHNEMRLLASIRHPHVVQLLGYAAEGHTQCLVYELMARGNLEDILAGKGGNRETLTWPMRVRIAAQMAHALAHLHTKGIIHRDVKPANMFLDCDFNAKLGDIGLASLDSGISNAEEAIGTWSYLAPEYKHSGRSSSKTDIYAFGLSILQLMTAASQTQDLVHTCQIALEACNLPQVLDKRAGEWDLLAAERMVKLSLWCSMHDPEQRPSMAMIFTDLQRILRQLQQLGLEPL
ncbi:hypothetical protein CEUSTIGMA_g3493.t1 [Chlamydomonas eustigma]|uniref:Protein kinase domain-containing protein n=1 Tax=Chlamydomonas eustigma TaxID=1157962 RepID=A0A250WZW3_9CHLO|nr:hypothetical protein CEUSTIGMA_g3493.t1 [Chlamydomonas eustigma]|eukprot:GAX76050.1 hypothetical protein CEUSTIGMA_g3493.t1 [Chlamydomonas eustigma]